MRRWIVQQELPERGLGEEVGPRPQVSHDLNMAAKVEGELLAECFFEALGGED